MEGKPGVTERKGAPYYLVQRRASDDGTLPQHDRDPDRDDRPPDPAVDSFPAGETDRDSNLLADLRARSGTSASRSCSITANRAILTRRATAKVLYDIYRMGADEIQWGNQDH